MKHRVEAQIGAQLLILETGQAARQADGAIMARYGDSVVFVSAVASKTEKDVNFLPLTVDFQEKSYAGGKIPGSFFRREGRLGEREILTCRLIDRPLRPLFPDNWHFETQILAYVLSIDECGVSDILGIVGASAALTISDIPFQGPIGAVRVGHIEGNFVINPSLSEIENSDMNIVVVGTKNAVMMVESEIKELPEETVLAAITFGHEALQEVIALQLKLQELVGKEKRPDGAMSSLWG